MKHIAIINSFYKKCQRFLTKSPFRQLSFVLSHGFVHFIIAIIVAICTYLWYQHNITYSQIHTHNLLLSMTPLSTIPSNPDTIYSYNIKFKINSQSVSDSTEGRYKNMIEIGYSTCNAFKQQIIQKDSTKRNTIIGDSVQINLFSFSPMRDLTATQYTKANKTIDTKNTNHGVEYITKQVNLDPTIDVTKDDESYIEVKVVPLRNHEGINPDYLIEGEQIINIFSNGLGLIDNTPYYNYFVKFDLPPTDNSQNCIGYKRIEFEFGDIETKNGIKYNNRDLLYNYIYPEPDIINNGYICYFTREKMIEISRNNGIIIQAEDVNSRNNNLNASIIYSVLVGTGAAFLLDIIVQLVRELRNLNRRKDKDVLEKENDETKDENV